MFSFRSAVETGEYRFTSLNPAKLPQGLTPAARGEPRPAARPLRGRASAVASSRTAWSTVAIRKQPQIDFLPIVDEARRVLDDGNQEFAPVDLSQISLPTEKAAMFVGKTTITPSPKRRIRQVRSPRSSAPRRTSRTSRRSLTAATSSPPSLTSAMSEEPTPADPEAEAPRARRSSRRNSKPAKAPPPKPRRRPSAKPAKARVRPRAAKPAGRAQARAG